MKENSGSGGSLSEGLSEKTPLGQEKPRNSGQGDRPAKGSGTTTGGGGGKDKD